MRLVRVVIPVILIALLVFWDARNSRRSPATDAVQEQLVVLQAEAEPIALEAVGLSGWGF